MKLFGIIFLFVAALTGAGTVATVPAQAQYASYPTAAPKGSYRQSCRDIKFSSDVLTARCDMGTTNGDFLSNVAATNTSTLPTKNCSPSADIWNQFGELYCVAKPGMASDHAIPAGSYIQSCTAISVISGILQANCPNSSDSTQQNSLPLSMCDLNEGIDNIEGVLICSPAAAQSTATTQQAITKQTSPPPSPVQAALKGAGCSWFLGRPNQYVCFNHPAFIQCVGYVAKGQVMSCMAADEIHTDCRRFLGRDHEFICTSRVAFLQCQNYLAKGKLGVTKCLDATPKPKKTAMDRRAPQTRVAIIGPNKGRHAMSEVAPLGATVAASPALRMRAAIG